MNYKNFFYRNKNIDSKKEKENNRKEIKNNHSSENKKNVDFKYKNNKNNFILPPIKKYNVYK